MEFYSVYDKEFKTYGQVLKNYDTADIITVLNNLALPAEGVEYVPAVPILQELPVYEELKERAFGGMPMQLGVCMGRNTRLNCLEYHRNSEINIGSSDFFLLLAHIWQIRKGKLSTKRVKCFRVPAGVPVELYAATLHYAPCHADWGGGGFRVAVALPAGTNTALRMTREASGEDKLLWARNKWLLAHKDAPEARQGAYVGLIGENIDLEKML